MDLLYQSNDTSISRKKRTAIACFVSENSRSKAKEKLNQLELGGHKIEAVEIQDDTIAKIDEESHTTPKTNDDRCNSQQQPIQHTALLRHAPPCPATPVSVYDSNRPPPVPLAPHLG
jgi:hypothetical protein